MCDQCATARFLSFPGTSRVKGLYAPNNTLYAGTTTHTKTSFDVLTSMNHFFGGTSCLFIQATRR